MRPAIQLQSIMKSMRDNVLPAIDPNNKLALEQAKLILGMLNIMSQRMDLQYRYDRDELERIVGFAEFLQRQARGGDETKAAREALASAAARGADVLERAKAEPPELVHAIKDLRATAGAVVQAICAEGDPESKEAVREGVLANAREQLLRERSWLIMQGWEADPSEVPPIESIIGYSPATRNRQMGV
jgi:hypothetical protein